MRIRALHDVCRLGLLAISAIAMTGHAREPTDFSLDDLKWEHRVLVIGAPSPGDERLQAQRQAVTMSASDFTERDLVLVQLFEDPGSLAGEDEISADAAERIRDRLDIDVGQFTVLLIGKDGTVKLRDDEPVPMRQVYALIDTMPMRRREIREESP